MLLTSVTKATFTALGTAYQKRYDIRSYGARCDVTTLAGGALTTGGIYTLAGAAFSAADVGKLATAIGMGPTGLVAVNTVILAQQSASQVTLAAGPAAALSAVTLVYCTDDTAAIQAAIAAIAASGLPGEAYIPARGCGITHALTFPASFISLAGAAMGFSRLLWMGGATWTQNGMIAPTDFYNQVRNDIHNITIDAFGQNQANVPFQTPLVLASSKSRYYNIEFCNKAGAQGAPVESGWYLLILSPEVACDRIYLHDDYAPVMMTAALPATAGAASLTVANSAGAMKTGNVVVDPSVAVTHKVAIVHNSSVAQTVTPRGLYDNLWPNGGVTAGMRGIFVGQTLQVGSGRLLSVGVTNGGTLYADGSYNVPLTGGRNNNGGLASVKVTVTGGVIQNTISVNNGGIGNSTSQTALSLNLAGATNATTGAAAPLTTTGTPAAFSIVADLIESVVVTATTTSTWSGVFTQDHPAGWPASYTGVTETCLISSVPDSTHVNCTLQWPHPDVASRPTATCALLFYPFTSDGIGIGNNHYTPRVIHTIKVTDCHGVRTGLDMCGWATMTGMEFAHNTAYDCIVGIIAQDSHNVKVVHNTFDFSGLGLVPLGGPNYNGLSIYAQAPEFAVLNNDILCDDNRCIGGYVGAYGVANPGSGVLYDGLALTNNHFRGQYGNGILLASVSSGLVSENHILNCNQAQRTTDVLTGGDIGGILLVSVSATQAIKNLKLADNDIIDTQGHMHSGIQGLATVNWSNVTSAKNTIVGQLHNRIQYSTGFPVVDLDEALGPTPAFPASSDGTTNWVQNTSGFDAVVALNLTGVTQTHIWVNSTPTTAGASDYTANPVTSELLLAGGSWFACAYSAGTPTWIWYKAQSRLVGFAGTVPPVTGTYQAGDVMIDARGLAWVCSNSGSPGVWLTARTALQYGDQGIKGSAFADPATPATINTAFTANALRITRVPVHPGDTISTAYFSLGAAGSGVSGFYVGLYANSGTTATQVAATADLSAALVAGQNTAAFTTPYTVPAGVYWLYVAFLCVAASTTFPTLSQGSGIPNAGLTQGTSAGRSMTGTAAGSLPSTLTSSANYSLNTPVVAVA